jgi:hypothetical protein
VHDEEIHALLQEPARGRFRAGNACDAQACFTAAHEKLDLPFDAETQLIQRRTGLSIDERDAGEVDDAAHVRGLQLTYQ